jgi:hypothetical protein
MNAIILRHCIHLEMAKAIPEGYHSITPYLVVNDAVAAIDYYKCAFDAKETYRHPGPDGKSIINAELRIGDSILLLSDEFPHGGCLSPKSIGIDPGGVLHRSVLLSHNGQMARYTFYMQNSLNDLALTRCYQKYGV